MRNTNKTILLLVLTMLWATATFAQGSVNSEYRRLIALGKKLENIPIDRQDREPYKSLIRRNKKDIVYSEPAGQWFVNADRYWELAKKHKTLAIADNIAWTAAQTPLPGECEGFLNCYVYNANATLGEYLRMFPAGGHTRQAMSSFVEWLSPMTAPDARSTYDGPADRSDKLELQRMIGELRKTLDKVKGSEEARALLDKLERIYK